MHFGTGSLCFWQDSNTPPPSGMTYVENTTCVMSMDYVDDTMLEDNNWALYVDFDFNSYGIEFSNGAIIDVYYKPL